MCINAFRQTSVRILAESDRDVRALRNVVDLALDAYRNSPAHTMRGTVAIKRAGFIGAELEELERALTVLAEATGIGSNVDLSPHLGVTTTAETVSASPTSTDGAMAEAPETAAEEAAYLRAVQLARERSTALHQLLQAWVFGVHIPAQEAA